MPVPPAAAAALPNGFVLCLPGDAPRCAALRAAGHAAIGIVAAPAEAAAVIAGGGLAFAIGPELLAHHRHKFASARVELAALPAADRPRWLAALASAVRPGGVLQFVGGASAAEVATADATATDAAAPDLVARRRPAPALAMPGYRVAPFADLLLGCRQVVEIGCGTGRFLDALALREIPCRGIEDDPAAAAESRRRGHTVLAGGLAALAAAGPVDGVHASAWCGNLPAAAQAALFAACRQALAPQGRLVLRCPRPQLAAVAAALPMAGFGRVWHGAVPGDPADAADGYVVAIAAAAGPPLPPGAAELVLHSHEPRRDGPLRSCFDLERCERRIHSQGGEDGLLLALFEHLGSTNRSYVEFGCGDGVQCNTAALRRQGWTGVLFDGQVAPGAPDAVIQEAWITRDNINALFDRHGVPAEPDLMSIDLDGNDYWVWQAIQRRPRVVVAEYNGNLAADRALTIAYDPQHRWDGSDFYGASLLALQQLGRQKGYTLVYCTQAGVNAVFVRDDLLGAAPAVAPAALYRPANYWYRGGRSRPDLTRRMVEV